MFIMFPCYIYICLYLFPNYEYIYIYIINNIIKYPNLLNKHKVDLRR